VTESNTLVEKLSLMLQKADRSLTAAQRHIEAGDYDFASSRAYYAAFYTMQAILLTKNLTAAKHAGAIRMFNQHFIKTGLFPPEFNQFISRLFRNRQAGDYMLGLRACFLNQRQRQKTLPEAGLRAKNAVPGR
jgi:uncharacterized protein (UPF0332 family)